MKNNLIASLNQRLYVLNSLRNKCPRKCLKNLAHGLIYSKLAFGIQYYSGGHINSVKTLGANISINKACRVLIMNGNTIEWQVQL